jgi:hypothetical protein
MIRPRLSIPTLLWTLAALLPATAGADPPTTVDGWLAVFRERQARFVAVSLDSRWERFEAGAVVEAWDQQFYADDLGRMRIAELGRIELGRDPHGAGFIADRIYAFDGSEDREFTTRWASSSPNTLTASDIATLRGTAPKARQARLQASPSEHAAIYRTETPFKSADFWFLFCMQNAEKTSSPLVVSPLPDTPHHWEVLINSSKDEFGHKCRAVVHEGQDNHVTRIELWAQGGWTNVYETTYGPQDVHWSPSGGTCSVSGKMFWRFTVTRTSLGSRLPDTEFLPTLPEGTWVGDRRTGATYQVGLEGDSDRNVASLIGTARQQYAARHKAAEQRPRWSSALQETLLYGALGAVLGAGVIRVAHATSAKHKATLAVEN